MSRPEQTIQQCISQPDSFRPLIQKHHPLHRQKTSEMMLELKKLPAEDTTRIARYLIDGLGKETDFWDQNKRDTALVLLQMLPFTQLDSRTVFRAYTESLMHLNQYSDPFGSLEHMYQAGTYLFSLYDTVDYEQTPIIDTWRELNNLFAHTPQGEYVREYASAISRLARLKCKGEWEPSPQGRVAPTFEQPEEQELHDLYLENTKGTTSLKPLLWEHTPKYRKLVAERGIDLAQFWNITPVEKAQLAWQKIQQKDKELLQQVSDTFAKETGTILRQTLVPVMADEFIHAMQTVKKQLSNFRESPRNVIERIMHLAQESQHKGERARSAIIKQAETFLARYALHYTVKSPEDIIRVFSTTQLSDHAYQMYTREGQKQKDRLAMLAHYTPPVRGSISFSLFGRTRQDLYLGDQTADCTAYHLDTGFNAWTLPSWLSNPGFVFFITHFEGTMYSKFGIYLALEGNEKVLVIDSIEYAKGHKIDSHTAVIHSELYKSIRSWAQSYGIDHNHIYINKTTNSKEAIEINQTYHEKTHPRLSVVPLGNLDGINEFKLKTIGGKPISRTYMQSERYEDDTFEEPTDEWGDIPEYLALFEKHITEAIKKASPQTKKIIEQAGRQANWEDMFTHILTAVYPQCKNYFGATWQDYQEFYTSMQTTKTGDAYVPGADLDLDSIGPIRYHLLKSPPSRVRKELYELETFLIDLKEIEARGVTFSDFLTQIFGNKVAEIPNTIFLNTKALYPLKKV